MYELMIEIQLKCFSFNYCLLIFDVQRNEELHEERARELTTSFSSVDITIII